jgi:pantoate--beta-alanine ligase
MQFAPGEDLARYPTDLKRDERLLEEGETHILFLPSGKEIYPEGFQTALCVEKLEKKLCGMTRPTHFKGVCTVVLKLFEIVKPDVAFFGQKDAQQSRIIRRMVEDLNLDVVIEVLPIVRERDGLAMSSRNSYLLPEERKGAAVIFRTLCDASRRIQEGERDPGKILQNMRDAFRAVPNCRIDYLKILNPDTLEDMEETIEGEMLIAAAVYFGSTRLIDNVVVAVGSETSGKEARRV